ncbi:MAG: carbohydrate-binding family 9-like protein [Planctomycetaceae bacterium]
MRTHILSQITLWSSLLLAAMPMSPAGAAEPAAAAEGVFRVKPSDDFEVTGDGKNPAWSKTEWVRVPLRTKDKLDYQTRVKMLYSPTGVYVLFDAADKKLSATMKEDNGPLWMEDILEVFLWPDEEYPVYFEYEISPLGYELPILVPNFDGKIMGWLPWFYGGDRKVRKATAVTGGPKESGAAISGWTAEVFIPYDLLKPLRNVPPKPGTQWRANFFRMDYDDGKDTHWTWMPVEKDFHEYKRFGKLVFE